MAKKEVFNVDDFGFDKELDFEDSSFEMTPPKDDRSPITKAAKGFAAGAKDTAFSNQFVKKFIKTTLPQGYGDAVTMAGEGLGEASKLYNSTVHEIKPAIKEAKKITKRILPSVEGKIPKKLADKLNKWSEASGESSSRSEDYRESGISAQLAEIFAEQMKEASKESQQAEVKDAVKESIETKRHTDVFGQLEGIRLSTARLSSYQDKVTSGFQRKSLELQYRHYYIASDMLEEQKKANEQFRINLAEIVKNTGLPEYTKIQNSERLADMMRNKFSSKIYDSVFDGRTGYVGKVVNKLGTRIKDKVTGFANDVQSGLSMAEMGMDANDSMKEMGAGISPYEAAGSFAGGLAADSIGTRVGKRVGKALNSSRFGSKIRTVGNDLEYATNNISQIGDKFSRGDYDYDEGMTGKIISAISKLPGGATALDALKEASYTGRPDASLQSDNIKDMQGPAIFSNQARKSITEVIPGFLSRIYQELQIIRTGNDKVGLTEYDYSGNKFATTKAMSKNLMDKIIDKNQIANFKNDNDEFINRFDPEGKLSKEERAELGKFFLTDNLKNGLADPKRFTNSSEYKDVSAETANKTIELFKTSFGIDDFGDVQDKEAYSDKRNKFAKHYSRLGSDFSDSRSVVQQIMNLGNYDFVRNAGLINEKGEFSQDQLYKYMAGDGGPNNDFGDTAGGGVNSKLGKLPIRRNRWQDTNSADNSTISQTGPSVDYSDVLKDILTSINKTNSVEFNKTSSESIARIEKILLEGQIGSSAKGSGSPENKRWYQASIGDIIGSISSGVSSGLSYTGDLLQKGAKGAVNFGKNLMQTGLDAASKSASWLLKKRDEYCDLYVKGEVNARIQAWRMKAGHYIDSATGKVIRKLSDIKGHVVDRDGNIVLSMEDMKNIIPPDVRSNAKKAVDGLINLGKKAISITNDFYGTVFNAAKSVFSTGKNAITKLLAADVYVAGEDQPRLLAITMRVGGYRSKITGRIVWTPKQIDGPILNIDGEQVLTDADLRKGIVDKNGKPIRSLMSSIADLGKKTLSGAKKFASSAFDTLKGATQWAGRKTKDVVDAGIDTVKNAISIIGQPKVIARLTEIRDLLKDRLPERKKTLLGDTDGDGDRENSWQDMAQKKASLEKQKAAGKSGLGANKGLGLGGLAGGKKEEEKEEKEGGGLGISDIRDGWDMAKGGLKKVKGWGGKALSGASKLAGKVGLKGLGLAGAAYGGYSAIDNVSKGNYGEAALDAGLAAGGAAMTAGGLSLGGGMLAGMGTGLGALAVGITGILSSPVVLGALAVGGGYLAYKYLSKKKLEPLSTYRFAQYGFLVNDTDPLQRVFGLEEKLMSMVEYSKGTASIKDSVLLKDLLDIFGINYSDKPKVARFAKWYQYRFKPVFLTHMSVLNGMAPGVSLSDVDSKLKGEEKKKYFDSTKFPDGPYSYLASPISDIETLTVGPGEVSKAAQICEEELKKETKDKKSDSGIDEVKTVTTTAAAAAAASLVTGDKNSSADTDVDDLNKTSGLTLVSSDPLQQTKNSLSRVSGADSASGTSAGFSSADFLNVENDEKQITPLNAIRYRAYGLYALEVAKINNLLALEQVVLEQMSFSGTSVEWNGSIDEVIRRCGSQFGVISYNTSEGGEFAIWFNTRFLPIFYNYVGTVFNLTGKKNVKEASKTLTPSQLLAVANAIYASKGDFNGISNTSIWSVTSSPWSDYVINTNDATISDSLKALAVKTSEDIGNEKIPSQKADALTQSSINKDESQAKANVSLWDKTKSMISNAGNWIADKAKAATTAVTETAGKAWDATKAGASAAASGISDAASATTAKVKDVANAAVTSAGVMVNKVADGIGGMLDQIPMPTGAGTYAALKDTIGAASKMVGVDEKLMAIMAAIESGFKYGVKADTSSATGLYQFISSTWKYMVKNYGAKYGIGPGTLPTDPRANALMGAEFLKMNMSKLAPSIGRQPTYTDMYLAHFMGDGGARKFLRAMNENPNGFAADMFPAPAAANKGIFYNKSGQPRTFKEIYDHFTSMITKKAKAFNIDSGMASSAATTATPPPTAPSGEVPQGSPVADGLAPADPKTIAGTKGGAVADATAPMASSKTSEMIATDSQKAAASGASSTATASAPTAPGTAGPVQAGFSQAPQQVASQINTNSQEFNKSIGVTDKTLMESLEVHRASHKVLQDILIALSNGAIKMPNAASPEPSSGVVKTEAKATEMMPAPIPMRKQA